MPLDFIGEPVALRTATKVAYFALAKVAGRRFGESSAFSDARQYIATGEGSPARLFVNQNYAANTNIGPHQHFVQVYCNGAERTVYATVTFFGGLSYLVPLSTNYDGADHGFSYAYDSLQRKVTPLFVGQFENERLATEDVRKGHTVYDNVLAMSEHWAKYIQSVATARITPL
jgi:hypothetical protein